MRRTSPGRRPSSLSPAIDTYSLRACNTPHTAGVPTPTKFLSIQPPYGTTTARGTTTHHREQVKAPVAQQHRDVSFLSRARVSVHVGVFIMIFPSSASDFPRLSSGEWEKKNGGHHYVGRGTRAAQLAMAAGSADNGGGGANCKRKSKPEMGHNLSGERSTARLHSAGLQLATKHRAAKRMEEEESTERKLQN